MKRESELIYRVIDLPPFIEGHVPLTFVHHLHYVRGMSGAVSFSWREMTKGTPPPQVAFIAEPIGIDVGYHRPVQTQEWQCRNQQCPALGGKECWTDGSSLRASLWMEQYLLRGKDEGWLREKLSDYYHEVFNGDAEPSIANMDFGQVMNKIGKIFGEDP